MESIKYTSPMDLVFSSQEGLKVERNPDTVTKFEKVKKYAKPVFHVAKHMVVFAMPGAGIGGGIAKGVQYFGYAMSARKALKVGAGIGLIVGLGSGIKSAFKYKMALPEVESALSGCSEKANKVLATVLTNWEENYQDKSTNKGITCPISCDVFVFPVKLTCNHTFEYIQISKWFKNKTACPSCRHENANALIEMSFDVAMQMKVGQAARDIFMHLENLLAVKAKDKMPPSANVIMSFVNTVSNFANSEEQNKIITMGEEIKQAKTLFDNDDETLVKKVMANDLSLIETCALAICITEKLRPQLEKIEVIYNGAKRLIEANVDIDNREKVKSLGILGEWYLNITESTLPPECRKIRKIVGANLTFVQKVKNLLT